MTDLTKAIAKLFAAAKELAEYTSYSEIVGGVSVNRPQIRRGCDAVFAAIAQFPEDENFGRFVPALIPATERDAAVAAAMEGAAALCIQLAQEAKDDNGTGWASHSWLMTVARTIQSEITQPQADALARVRAEAVKIKPLVWRFFDVEHSFGKGVYDANSIGHTYTIQDCGKRDLPMRFYVSAISASFAELSDAKSAAQADHDARIRAAIGGVE